MSTECMLSTIDNPFDPFEQFDDWFMFDLEKNYNSCSYLARIVDLSDDMTQREVDIETERAIDEIVSTNPLGIYIKVTRQSEDN